jgi:hypothetical protein
MMPLDELLVATLLDDDDVTELLEEAELAAVTPPAPPLPRYSPVTPNPLRLPHAIRAAPLPSAMAMAQLVRIQRLYSNSPSRRDRYIERPKVPGQMLRERRRRGVLPGLS